ncbi:hypothetical protein PFISCL1PPCAC_6803, partial [Pristionchus fissidentatus]
MFLLFCCIWAKTTAAGCISVWPSMTVPFVVDPVIEDDSERIIALDNALAHLSRVTCLSFIQRTKEKNFIIFTELSESLPCWDVLSMKGGEQMVNVGGNCLEPVKLPATVTRIFSDCDLQKVQYLYPCPGILPVRPSNCTSIFNRVNNVAASVVPCETEDPDSCPYPTYRNNTLPVGSACSSACDYSGRLLPLLRSFNPRIGVFDHFYTTDTVTDATMTSNGYDEEDPVGYLGMEGPADAFCTCLRPLFRLFHPVINNHFYTSNETERAGAEALGYKFERIEGYCTSEPACGAYMPLSRFFAPLMSDHLYTTAVEEATVLKNTFSGYGFERVECYLWQYETANRACETLLH